MSIVAQRSYPRLRLSGRALLGTGHAASAIVGVTCVATSAKRTAFFTNSEGHPLAPMPLLASNWMSVTIQSIGEEATRQPRGCVARLALREIIEAGILRCTVGVDEDIGFVPVRDELCECEFLNAWVLESCCASSQATCRLACKCSLDGVPARDSSSQNRTRVSCHEFAR